MRVVCPGGNHKIVQFFKLPDCGNKKYSCLSLHVREIVNSANWYRILKSVVFAMSLSVGGGCGSGGVVSGGN